MGLLSLVDLEGDWLRRFVELEHFFGYFEEERTSLDSFLSQLRGNGVEKEDVRGNSREILAFNASETDFYLCLAFQSALDDLLGLLVGEPRLRFDDGSTERGSFYDFAFLVKQNPKGEGESFFAWVEGAKIFA